jgi:hypothetical protein
LKVQLNRTKKRKDDFDRNYRNTLALSNLVLEGYYKNILLYIEPINYYIGRLATLKEAEFTTLK